MLIVERLMVRRELRGGPLPLQLLVFTGQFIVEHDIHLVFCNCEPHLVNLYRRLGFRSYRNGVDFPGIGFVIPLVLVVPDLPHLRAINSPFLYTLGEERTFPPGLVEKIVALLPARTVVKSADDPDAEAFWSDVHGLMNRMTEPGRSFFEGLDEAQIRAVTERSQIFSLARGQRLLRKGGVTRNLFVALDGVLEARDWDRVLAVCHAARCSARSPSSSSKLARPMWWR